MTTLGFPLLGVKAGFPGSSILHSSPTTAWREKKIEREISLHTRSVSSYILAPGRIRDLGLARDRSRSGIYVTHLVYDAALVGARGERVEVDGALDAGLDVAHRLEADVGLQERARDLVEAVGEHLVVHHGRVLHPRQRAGDAPAQLREHHLGRRTRRRRRSVGRSVGRRVDQRSGAAGVVARRRRSGGAIGA